jgi:hypothetical protein
LLVVLLVVCLLLTCTRDTDGPVVSIINHSE